MAYRSAPLIDDLIWRTPLLSRDDVLADSVRDAIAEQREYLLDFTYFNEAHPSQALTLGEWSTGTELRSLLACYSNHIYRDNLDKPRENKPLISLWAQWYIGLMAPPLLLALLTQPTALDVSPEHFHVEFHETGRAAKFWIDVYQDRTATALPPEARIDTLITRALIPVVDALEATGDINGKLIWSNTGYLLNWCLGEMKALLGDEKVDALRRRCFFEKQLADGSDNPLWRTVVPRDGLLVRRTCCQRYRLPDVQQCGDCTLK